MKNMCRAGEEFIESVARFLRLNSIISSVLQTCNWEFNFVFDLEYF